MFNFQTQNTKIITFFCKRYHFSAFPVVTDTRILIGMVSRCDIDLIEDTQSVLIKDVMQKNIITGTEHMSLDEVYSLIKSKSIPRLPIVNNLGQLVSLVCRKDLRELRVHPLATRWGRKKTHVL